MSSGKVLQALFDLALKLRLCCRVFLGDRKDRQRLRFFSLLEGSSLVEFVRFFALSLGLEMLLRRMCLDFFL